jgi:uncharacterized membrane protein YhiD involved in acid resistance
MNWSHIVELLQKEMASGIVASSMARLVLAALPGGAIGLERELRHRLAGLHTIMFICFVAASVGMATGGRLTSLGPVEFE